MRTTIDIPEILLERAKDLASERGKTLSAFVQTCIVYRIVQLEEQCEPTSPFKLITVKGNLVNDDIDLSRSSSILTADDEEKFSEER